MAYLESYEHHDYDDDREALHGSYVAKPYTIDWPIDFTWAGGIVKFGGWRLVSGKGANWLMITPLYDYTPRLLTFEATQKRQTGEGTQKREKEGGSTK